MKLYNSRGPNPKVVRMFAAEKAIALPLVDMDILKGENRQAAHFKRNPSGQVPVLELDDGRCISEVTAICEYLEEKFPQKPLIGMTAEERAEARMWTRKVDLNICEPMANGFRFGEGVAFFKERIHTEPDASQGLKRLTQANLKWLDAQLVGKEFIAGKRFTLADILLYSFVDFFAKTQPINPELKNVDAWLKRVSERPSARA